MYLTIQNNKRKLLIACMLTVFLFISSCGGDYPSKESGDNLAQQADNLGNSAPDQATGSEEVVFKISQPPADLPVSGTTRITASVSSGTIDRIEFYIDDVFESEDTTPPYEYDWDTTIVNNTGFMIKLIAYDLEGNSYEQILSVDVDNTIADKLPPVISSTTPVTGSFLNGTINVSASVSDNIGLSNVEFYIDGNLKSISSILDIYNFQWDTTGVSNGVHKIRYEASDTSGNTTLIDNTNVFLLNRDERDCPGSAVSWDLTGTWTTTLNTNPPTEFMIYITQTTPCFGNTFDSWGYNADTNLFVSTPGNILNNNLYEIITDSWPRVYVRDADAWLQIDRIYWTPSDGGNKFQGKTELSLYWNETGSLNFLLPQPDDVVVNGIRNN